MSDVRIFLIIFQHPCCSYCSALTHNSSISLYLENSFCNFLCNARMYCRLVNSIFYVIFKCLDVIILRNIKRVFVLFYTEIICFVNWYSSKCYRCCILLRPSDTANISAITKILDCVSMIFYSNFGFFNLLLNVDV